MPKFVSNLYKMKALFTCCGKGVASDDICAPKETVSKPNVPWWRRFRKTKVTPLCAISGEHHMDTVKRSENEILDDLRNIGLLAKTGSGGVSYFVGLQNDKEEKQMMKKPRLLPKIEKTLESDDKQLIADIMHHDHIKTIKDKAKKNKLKAAKAAKRREELKMEECVYGFGKKE